MYMADRARKSSERSTGSSSDRRRQNTGSRQSSSSGAASSGDRVPSQVSIPDIAEQLCFWAKQSNKDGSPIIAGSTLTKKAFGFAKRLYSEIQTTPDKDNLTIDSFSHKFPIREIFFVKNEEEQHTLPLANGASTTFNTGVIHINAEDLRLSRRDSNGDITATVKQEATFNINTGEITLRLKEERAGILYESKYIVKGLYTLGARIKLNPYTVEEVKKIQPIQKTRTFFAKLNKTKVNIYAYLNSKATGTPNVTFSSSLTELKAKLEQLRRRIIELERMVQSKESQLEISQFKYVEKVLENEESLQIYKRDLNTWYENYKSWTIRPELVSPTIEGHQYILEFRKTGKPRVSKYMERLLNRTMPYDENIVVTEDTEVVTDYTQRESAEIDMRRDLNEVKRIQDLLDKATGRNNQTEILRYTEQLKEAKAKAKVTIEERMQRTDTIKSVSGFGLYPPYLLSDILRYGSIFMKTNVIDGLALSSENIGIFADNINGFKSLVFNFVSLFNQVAVHKISKAHLCTSALDDKHDVIIRTGYNSKIYPNLSWLYTPGADGSVPTYTIGSDITHPLRFMPCMGSAGSFNILKELKEEYLPKTRDLVLLSVDEPLFGTDELGGILDFDVIFSEQFKSAGVVGLLSSLVSNPLAENFRKLLEFRYDYSEDILPVEVDQSEFTVADFPDLGIDSTPSAEAIESVKMWGKLDTSNLAALAPEPQQMVPVKTQKGKKQEKQEKIFTESASASAYEDSFDFQDWTPVILSKDAASSAAAATRDTDPIPIRQISTTGKVFLASGHSHNYSSGDTVNFYGLEGTFPDMLKTGNWKIELIDNSSADTKTDSFQLVNFTYPPRTKAPTITKGFVRKIPDEYLGATKEHRDTSRDQRDKHIMSQSQWREAQEEYNARLAVKKFGFRSVEAYTREKNNKMIEELVTVVIKRIIGVKPFKARLLDGTISEQTLVTIIEAVKTSNPNNFLKLKIDELVEIIKFKLLNPEDTRNLNELYRALGLQDDIQPLESRQLTSGKSTVNGIMEQAVDKWHAELEGSASSENTKSKGKKSDKGSGKKNRDGYREKYLKYKEKYLTLKAKLGL